MCDTRAEDEREKEISLLLISLVLDLLFLGRLLFSGCSFTHFAHTPVDFQCALTPSEIRSPDRMISQPEVYL